MGALAEVIAPVFLIIGFGYLAVWRGYFSPAGVDGLMKFTQNFAIPVLLFRGISSLDLAANFDAALLASFYTGAFAGFLAGLIGGRLMFRRPWPDSVAIGFATMFSNAVLLGLPISERAFGIEALGPNFAIIAVHAPFCYLVGITAMELVRANGKTLLQILGAVGRAMAQNALVIGIALGFVVNLSGASMPPALLSAADMVAAAALPAALFGLGGVLVRYRPEGDMRVVLWICAVSLVLHPAIVWTMGRLLALEPEPFRAAVLTAAMAPGINAYIFANLYGVAKRVAASAVLVATGISVLTVWLWLGLLA